MITIAMPMAGEGKRFTERGYTFPKPLVEVARKPMVELVIQNLTPAEPHKFVFICREEHLRRFALSEVLRLLVPDCAIVPVRDSTAGALCSMLLAIEYLNHDGELLVANADQVVDASIDDFLKAARDDGWNGFVMTFPSTHPKWSYAKVEDAQVVAVAEKRPISRHATAGLYYFQRSLDFLDAAERMIVKNATVAGEFFVAPVYNELILKGKRVGIHPIERDQMYSLGTPEDLDLFLNSTAYSGLLRR